MSSDFPFISAYQIEARHSLLEALLGKVKPEETESLETARTLVTNITTCLCVFSLMEAACYYLFSTVVTKFKYKIYVNYCVCLVLLCYRSHMKLVSNERKTSREAALSLV